jgi:hypothetical protein
MVQKSKAPAVAGDPPTALNASVRAQTKPLTVYAEDPSLQTLYFDTFLLASEQGGSVVFTLGDRRFTPTRDVPEGPVRVGTVIHVGARIALAPGAAVELVQHVGTILRRMQAKATAQPMQDERTN